ncbi:MAG: NADH-quinone oxidoreductase subunit NuoB [Oligoflexia bacterium]|nr:NADH-quinone oxidoreductase subunit NuoB [Oligoflexia bacterium]
MSWLTTRYETIVTRLENKHHFPWVMSEGCCTTELENAGLATYDWQRLGVDDIATDPSQSNLLLIAGWINEKRAEEIKFIYDQMRKPTSVIAIGACVLSGSPYSLTRNKSEVIRASDLVPVDINVVGCPPRPEAILSAILELQKKLKPGPSAREVLHEALRG